MNAARPSPSSQGHFRKPSVARRGPRGLAPLLAVAALLSCMDATDVELLEVAASGMLLGQAYLDLNGNGALDATDVPLGDASVVLTSAATQEMVDEATTDAQGLFALPDVVVGTYDLSVGTATLGDSLVTVDSAGSGVTIEFGDTIRITLGASFPHLTIDEVRASPPGRRVFTAGIALNSRVNPDPVGQVHFQGPSSYLRALNVARGNLSTGDSVRLLGRTAVDAGQPVLDIVSPFVLVQLATIPLPEEVSTGSAAAAGGGPLDAALVRIRRTDISDTSTVSGDFHFWVDDGSGRLEVVLRSFLGINPAPIQPETTVGVSEAVGLLSAYDDGTGVTRWRLLPRGGGDVTIAPQKFADVGVETSFDVAQAAQGESVEITVVVTNTGPFRATGLEVADTVAAELSFVSATTTAGSYDEAEGLWTIDELLPNASDTLRIQVEVAAPAPATADNRAFRVAPALEVDPNGVNDMATTSLTIS